MTPSMAKSVEGNSPGSWARSGISRMQGPQKVPQTLTMVRRWFAKKVLSTMRPLRSLALKGRTMYPVPSVLGPVGVPASIVVPVPGDVRLAPCTAETTMTVTRMTTRAAIRSISLLVPFLCMRVVFTAHLTGIIAAMIPHSRPIRNRRSQYDVLTIWDERLASATLTDGVIKRYVRASATRRARVLVRLQGGPVVADAGDVLGQEVSV